MKMKVVVGRRRREFVISIFLLYSIHIELDICFMNVVRYLMVLKIHKCSFSIVCEMRKTFFRTIKVVRLKFMGHGTIFGEVFWGIHSFMTFKKVKRFK